MEAKTPAGRLQRSIKTPKRFEGYEGTPSSSSKKTILKVRLKTQRPRTNTISSSTAEDTKSPTVDKELSPQTTSSIRTSTPSPIKPASQQAIPSQSSPTPISSPPSSLLHPPLAQLQTPTQFEQQKSQASPPKTKHSPDRSISEPPTPITPSRPPIRSKQRPTIQNFDDVIPNTVLPFWDARTAADVHEDDNVKELVHCLCGITQESGLMIQCEVCLTWQHGACMDYQASEEVPDGYTCAACVDPKDVRESMKYIYDQEWLTKGKMRCFPCDSLEQSADGMNRLMKTHELIARLLILKKKIHSYQVKTKILETAGDGDPRLKLFRYPQRNEVSSIPDVRPDKEVPAEECRDNLKDHLKEVEEQINETLRATEEEVVHLENEIPRDPDKKTPSLDSLREDLVRMKNIVNPGDK